MAQDMINMNLKLKQFFFLLGLIALGGFIFYELNFFLSGFLGALTLYILCRKPLFYLTEKKNWRHSIAASVILAIILAVVSAFGYWMVNIIYAKVSVINPSTLSDMLNTVAGKTEELTGYKLLSLSSIKELQSEFLSLMSGLLNTTYSVVANLFMTFFLLFFMLSNARTMEKVIVRYVPFQNHSLSALKHEFHQMILSNAVGIPLVMLAQGCVATLIYLIFGVQNVVFWGFITGLFGLVPFVGTAVVWIPLGAFLLISSDLVGGIGILALGALVITNVDNLLRFILMKKIADTHPLITILGVIMGIPLFGFIGIIFGPLLISIFMLLLKLYRIEYFAASK
jgi:predicted PurR-regulated permease PerM